MRKFDTRERDRECLRVALRLKGEERLYIARLAREQRTTPAKIVMKLVEVSHKKYAELLKELEQP